jgi:hypothetical protein
MRYWLFGFALFLSIGCVENNDSGLVGDSVNEDTILQSGPDTLQSPEITVITYRNDTVPGVELTGWGFDLYKNGKRFIHQPTVPVVRGNSGFATEDQAQRAGQLVSEKIRSGVMPPSLDESDLKALGIHLP